MAILRDGQRRLASAIARIAASMAMGGAFFALSPVSHALNRSVGEDGIDARRLHAPPYSLTGKGVFIGQVELSRPFGFGTDKLASRLMLLDRAFLQPYALFQRDRKAVPNRNVDSHSTQVAAVMVGRNKEFPGVAPAAHLLSSAYALSRKDGQPEAAIAAQHIARQFNGSVRAINFSFGEPLNEDPRPQPQLDGNALLTLCLDWLASTFDTLPVVAGNQGKGGIPIPTDLYNGLTVGFTRRDGGVFRQLDLANLIDEPFIDRDGNGRYDPGEYFTDLNGDRQWTAGVEGPTDGRRSMALLAPGTGIALPDINGVFKPTGGSSYAAPHVVGTVALLQEYADRQILQRLWPPEARRHEVMKAVLLNSADKIADRGDGKHLGMAKTIVDVRGNTWLDTEAYRQQAIPLSRHLGAGQLNAWRAFLQFQPGPKRPGLVPPMAWDTGAIAVGGSVEYEFDRPLLKDSFVAITLTWDRQVRLLDRNGNGAYDEGEGFRGSRPNNLDLYLMRSRDREVGQSLWSSVSRVDNVEHIFFQIPTTGRYKLRVVFHRDFHPNHASTLSPQRYGLAWWAVPVPNASS